MGVSAEAAIAQTRLWVDRVVIGHNLCPFARREVEAGRVFYQVTQGSRRNEHLRELGELSLRLMESKSGAEGYIETAFLILPQGVEDFFSYLDFVDAANDVLEKQGFEGDLQLASFHPDYCFEGELDSDAANYTNRSPHPMVHLIREQSLEQALASFDAPEDIPARNIALTRELGADALAAQRQACLDLHKQE